MAPTNSNSILTPTPPQPIKSKLEARLSTYTNYDIPLSLIDVSSERGRQTFKNIDELADSISRLGQLQPIIVRHTPNDPNRYDLVAGERRLRAHQQLGLPTIRAVLQKDMSDLDYKMVELSENLDRESMTWQEEVILVRQIHTLVAREERTKSTIALTMKYTGKSQGFISEAIALAEALKSGNNNDLFEYGSREQAMKRLRMGREIEIMQELGRRLLEPENTFLPPSPSPSPSSNLAALSRLSQLEALIGGDENEGRMDTNENEEYQGDRGDSSENDQELYRLQKTPANLQTEAIFQAILEKNKAGTYANVTERQAGLHSVENPSGDSETRSTLQGSQQNPGGIPSADLSFGISSASLQSGVVPSSIFPSAEIFRSSGGKVTWFEVVQGNCMNVLPRLPDKSYAAIITDPLWGIDIEDNIKLERGFDTHFNDDPILLSTIIPDVSQEYYRLLVPNSFCFIFTAMDFFFRWKEALQASGFDVRPQPLIWVKEGGGYTNTSTKFMSRYEMIICASKGSRLLPEACSDILQFSRPPKGERIVATQKPIALLERLIQISTVPGERILDSFCGSGSGIVAAIRNSRLATGIDISLGMCRLTGFRAQKEVNAKRMKVGAVPVEEKEIQQILTEATEASERE